MAGEDLRQILRHRVAIVREIERRVPIESSGRDFRCQCPRHEDVTEPLYIDSERRVFTCFGCGWSGDVVDFIAECDSISPEEAMEDLRSALELDRDDEPTSKTHPERVNLGVDIDTLAKQLNLTAEQKEVLEKNYSKIENSETIDTGATSPVGVTPSVSPEDRQRELASITSSENLLLAWRKVKAFASEHDVYFDSKLFDLYEEHLEANLHELVNKLMGLAERGEPYQPGPFRHLRITKTNGGIRDIAIMARIEDRIVIQALLNVLAPKIEKHFSPNSFGHRLAKSFEKSDLIFERWPTLWGQYQEKLRKFLWSPTGCVYLQADITAFYDKVDRSRMHDLLADYAADDWTLGTLDRFLAYKILLDDGSVKDSGPHGIPQGPAYAHFFANLYLHEFDRFVEERIASDQDDLINRTLFRMFKRSKHREESKPGPPRKKSLGYSRYVDDFFILFKSRNDAEEGLETIKALLAEWNLQLAEDKTKIHESSDVEPVVEEMRSRKYTLGKLLDNDEELTVDQREALYEVVEKDFLALAGEDDLAKASQNIPFIVAKLDKSNYFQKNRQAILNLVIELLFSESFKHTSMAGVLKRIIPHVVKSKGSNHFADHLRNPATPDFKRVLFLQAVQENRFFADIGPELQGVVLDFLDHPTFFVRFAAANCLWANGYKIAHVDLRKRFKKEPIRELKGRLLHLLQDGGAESSFSTFLETAAKEHSETNYHALVAARGSRDALPKLIRRTRVDQDNAIFVEWLYAILWDGSREAMVALNTWAEDPRWASRISEAYKIILARVYDLHQSGHVTARTILEFIDNLKRLKHQRLRDLLHDGLLIPLRERFGSSDEDVRDRLIEFSDKAIRENKHIGPMLEELPDDAESVDIAFLNDHGVTYHAYQGNKGQQLDIWEFVEVERIIASGAFDDAYGWQDFLNEARRKGWTDFHDCEVLKDDDGQPVIVRVHYRLTSEYRRLADLLVGSIFDERRQARIIERIQTTCIHLENLGHGKLRAPTITSYSITTDISENVKMIGMGSAFCRPRYTSLDRASEIVDSLHSDSLFLGRLSFEMLTGKCPIKEAKRLKSEGGAERYLTHSEDLHSVSIFHSRLLRRLTYEFEEYRSPLKEGSLRRLIHEYPVHLDEMRRMKENGVSRKDLLGWQVSTFTEMRLQDVWRNPRFQGEGVEVKAHQAWKRAMDDVGYFCRSRSFAFGDSSDLNESEQTGLHLATSGLDVLLGKIEALQSTGGSVNNGNPQVRFNLAIMHLMLRYEALAVAMSWQALRFSEWKKSDAAKRFRDTDDKSAAILDELNQSGAPTKALEKRKLVPLADALKILAEDSTPGEPFSGCGLTALAAFIHLMATGTDQEAESLTLLKKLSGWEIEVESVLNGRIRLTSSIYKKLGTEQLVLLDSLKGLPKERQHVFGVIKNDLQAMTTRKVAIEIDGDSASRLNAAPEMVLALTSNPLEKGFAKNERVSADIINNECVAISKIHRALNDLFTGDKKKAGPNVAEHPAEKESENIFKRSGKVWMIKFNAGDVHHLDDRVGAHYLNILLSSPRKAFKISDLVQAVTKATVMYAANDAGELLDEQAIKEYRERYEDLQEEIREAEEHNDSARKEALTFELEWFLRELKAAVGKGGKPRKAASDFEKLRKRVYKAILDTRKAIEEDNQELAEHLQKTITCGATPSYNPPDDIEWDT